MPPVHCAQLQDRRAAAAQTRCDQAACAAFSSEPICAHVAQEGESLVQIFVKSYFG